MDKFFFGKPHIILTINTIPKTTETLRPKFIGKGRIIYLPACCYGRRWLTQTGGRAKNEFSPK